MATPFTCKLIETAVSTGAVAAGILAAVHRRVVAETPPTKWKHVGEVTDLYLYPVKACAPIRQMSFECGPVGLQDGLIEDRMFMIVTVRGEFVTARDHPQLLKIRTYFERNRLILSAPSRDDIEVNIIHVKEQPSTRITVWEREISVIDAGDEVARWISEFILGTGEGLRLVYYPDHQPNVMQFPSSDMSASPDPSGYTLINHTSVSNFNAHVAENVPPLQFRPSIVIKGPEAYAEEEWHWIRFGENTTFRTADPCLRCDITNVDPIKGELNQENEPLRTLLRTRLFEPNEWPIMGIYMTLETAGPISIGDHIYVDEPDWL